MDGVERESLVGDLANGDLGEGRFGDCVVCVGAEFVGVLVVLTGSGVVMAVALADGVVGTGSVASVAILDLHIRQLIIVRGRSWFIYSRFNLCMGVFGIV